VSYNFGNLFGSLITGSSARLVAAKNLQLESGVKVQVYLGNLWLCSIAELSGGQRTLLSLSFLLSLLLFKQSPIYILDEVDSALDYNFTVSLGRLIRSHFSRSQFLLVTLKEALIHNSDALVRIYMNEGTSWAVNVIM
jgi:structural maintenance of chromosome 2